MQGQPEPRMIMLNSGSPANEFAHLQLLCKEFVVMPHVTDVDIGCPGEQDQAELAKIRGLPM